MKKFKMSVVILSGLLCSCSPVAAQVPLKEYFTAKPVICGPIDKIIDSSKNLGEDPLLSADGLTLLDNRTLSTEPSKIRNPSPNMTPKMQTHWKNPKLSSPLTWVINATPIGNK